MKNRILIFVFSVLFILPSFAQLDRSIRPKPGLPPKIELGEYKSFTLDNGLKVFVVENDKLPVVNIRLVLDRDPIVEGENAGYISIAGDLLRTGTKNKTKDEIDEAVDFIGASLSTGSSSIYGSSLKKHSEKLLEIVSDIILNYDFKQEELDKLKKQYISNIKAGQDDPDAIAGNVKSILLYGKDHPYGELMTEETVESVTLDMCRNYIETYFKPNIGYLAFVGDITSSEAERLAKRYFSKWKKGDVPEHKYENPPAPEGLKIALVDRPASVQSVIHVSYPVHFTLGDPDYLPANLMNTIFGGTSTSRLYMNLRETKGYTYGAYSSLSQDRLVGSFNASLNARNVVTDSSVTEILNEMREYKKNGVKQEELQSIKSYVTGSFARALENPQTIASFAINTAIYNLPDDYYSTYLKKVADVSVEDVNKAIQEYIKPDSAYVLIVGNAEEIKHPLSKFGPITFYDIYGSEVDTAMFGVPEGLDGETVIQNYIKAIGGEENLEKVQDRTTVMSGKVQNFDISMTIYQKDPALLKQVVNAMGMQQVTIYDGDKGVMNVGDKKIDITGSELERLELEATLKLILDLKEHDINIQLKGMQLVEDKKAYIVEMILPDSTKWIQYYDPDTGLKVKDVKPLVTEQGTFTQETIYSDYREVEGVKYPFAIKQSLGPQKLDFTVSSIKVNTGLNDNLFKIE
ncbi:MAG: pitrilysin family protein [Ignavibacteriaceae bacterium]